MLNAGRFIPSRWGSMTIGYEIEIQKGLIQSVEASATSIVENYVNGVGTTSYVYNEDMPDVQFVSVHNGLDDMTFCLKSVFEEYYPSTLRASCFLNLYGAIESRFVDLYFDLQKFFEEGKPKRREDVQFINLITFILKRGGTINGGRELNQLRLLRNYYAHSRGYYDYINVPPKHKLLKEFLIDHPNLLWDAEQKKGKL